MDSDWEKQVEEFEKTRAGVKGLVDSGVEKVPCFFITPAEILPDTDRENGVQGLQIQIPVIDFQGVQEAARRREIVDEIRRASESWGFFQMVNHGVPNNVMDAILKSTQRFHEQPAEVKMDLYSSDGSKSVRFYTINGKIKKPDVASWRDAFACAFADDNLNTEAIPPICRDEIKDYMENMIHLRDVLSELLSEALGLNPGFLEQMQCMKSEYLTCLYYPPCPEPEKTFGAIEHSDPTILTILLQDNIGGLQILHSDNWVDVPPVPGALIANSGDLLQFLTNDKIQSVKHRVLSRSTGTRLSAACFFHPSVDKMVQPHEPIKELLSEDNPARYRQVTYVEFVKQYQIKNGRKDHSALSHFKV